MKKFRFKLMFTVLALLVVLVAVFTITSFGSTKSAVVTFTHGGVSYNKLVEEGDSITLPTPDSKAGGTVYGWFDKNGNFYNCGESISPTENIELFCAEGGEIALSGSFPLSISKGYTYIKLKSSITLNQTINLNDGILYIDLNGNNFSLNTDGDGFVGHNSGLIVANSGTKKAQINHIASGEVEFSLNSFLSLYPTRKASVLSFVIGENAGVNANMNLVSIKNNVDYIDGLLNVDIHGSLESGKFINSSGISGATFTVYETANVVSKSEYLFEDIGSAKTVLTFKVLGGELDLSHPTGYAADYTRYNARIYGGTYTTDIKDFFPYKNYVFTASGDKYLFSKCNHQGTLIEAASDCTTPVTLNHLCQYCDSVYPHQYSEGVGHSYMPVMSQEIVNTKEETKPGCYTLECTRCGATENRYTFPDPSTVYVTVGYMWKGEKIYKRVPANDLFSIDGTEVKSFSADALMHDELNDKGEIISSSSVPQADVFYVEIPLGTTTIFGDYRNENGGTPTGVFLRNEHLKEIELPVSIETIKRYAFSSMPNLEKVIGLEHITGSIGNYAFKQDANSKLFIEHMVLNANTIGEYAFQNVKMVSLTYGYNVKTIGTGAFSLGEGVKSVLKEVFVEGCLLNEVSVGTACQNARKSHAGGHQYGDEKIVYLEHAYKTTSIPATCKEYSYDLFTCERCSINEKRNIGTVYAPHKYEDYYKEATCQTYGVEGEKCTVCEYIFVHNNIPRDENTHIYTAREIKVALVPGTSYCIDPYFTLGQCICGAVEPNIPANRSETYYPPAGSNHKWTEKILKEPTCGAWGQTKITCDECGLSQTISSEPTEKHTWKKTPVSAPTCTVGERGIYTCTVCNKEENYSEPTLNPNNHTRYEGDVGEVVLEPTVDNYGQRRFVCAGCGAYDYESIPRLPKPEEEYKVPITLFGFINLDFIGNLPSVKALSNPIRTLITVLASIVVGVLLLIVVGGGVLALVFTFTAKKNKARGYKFRFKNSKGTQKSTMSVEAQLAAMNLTEEIPPDIPVSQDGIIDEEAAWTAYVDAINRDYQESNEQNDEADSNDDENDNEQDTMSDTGAWRAYVDAINQDYDETMEISLNEETEDSFSLNDIMQDTVFDLSIPSLQELEEEELARQEAEVQVEQESSKKSKKSKKPGKKSKAIEEEIVEEDEQFSLGDEEPLFSEEPLFEDEASLEITDESTDNEQESK